MPKLTLPESSSFLSYLSSPTLLCCSEIYRFFNTSSILQSIDSSIQVHLLEHQFPNVWVFFFSFSLLNYKLHCISVGLIQFLGTEFLIFYHPNVPCCWRHTSGCGAGLNKHLKTLSVVITLPPSLPLLWIHPVTYVHKAIILSPDLRTDLTVSHVLPIRVQEGHCCWQLSLTAMEETAMGLGGVALFVIAEAEGQPESDSNNHCL